jgi:hypothetical protein
MLMRSSVRLDLLLVEATVITYPFRLPGDGPPTYLIIVGSPKNATPTATFLKRILQFQKQCCGASGRAAEREKPLARQDETPAREGRSFAGGCRGPMSRESWLTGRIPSSRGRIADTTNRGTTQHRCRSQ